MCDKMFIKGCFWLATLLQLFIQVSGGIQPQVDRDYFILDYRNDSLTMTKGSSNSHLISSPFEGRSDQKWVFKISGDKRDYGDLFVIRPSSKPNTLTMDSYQTHWYSKLFNWSNTCLWIVRQTGYSQYQIIHNNDKLCLLSMGRGKFVGLGSCDAGERTWWTILPVEGAKKIPVGPKPMAT